MEARVEGRKGLFVPDSRASLVQNLRPLTMEQNLRKVLPPYQLGLGQPTDRYPTLRDQKLGSGVIISSAVRIGEDYNTYSLGLRFPSGSCKVFARYRRHETALGGDMLHVDSFEDPEQLFWVKRTGVWQLIELNSRLADQKELPIAIASGVEPDGNVLTFTSACLRLAGGSW